MADYKNNNTMVLEDRCFSLLRAIGLDIEKNNLVTVTDTDFKCGNLFIDFQYSCDFEKYEDLRIDVISAYHLKDDVQKGWQRELNKSDIAIYQDNEFKSFMQNWINVSRWGKVLNHNIKDYPHSLVYFIFNQSEKSLNFSSAVPDLIYFVKTKDLLTYINLNWKILIQSNSFKVNDKTSLGDSHGSAFFAVNLERLLDSHIGYFIDTNQLLHHTIN